MPKEGVEPSPCCQDGILNPARLPVPPLRLRFAQIINNLPRFVNAKLGLFRLRQRLRRDKFRLRQRLRRDKLGFFRWPKRQFFVQVEMAVLRIPWA